MCVHDRGQVSVTPSRGYVLNIAAGCGNHKGEREKWQPHPSARDLGPEEVVTPNIS